VSTPPDSQLEKFAAGIAKGYTQRRAADEAGYSPRTKSMSKWLRRPSFMDRVERYRRANGTSVAPDLLPIIERLVKVADAVTAPRASGEPPTAAAVQAARAALVEAARLKQLLPTDVPRAEDYYQMTREEWLATFAPKKVAPEAEA
jgi:hypothetical protein